MVVKALSLSELIKYLVTVLSYEWRTLPSVSVKGRRKTQSKSKTNRPKAKPQNSPNHHHEQQ